MQRIVPCYKCEDREVGCHGKCEKYISFRNEMEEIRTQIAKERMKYSAHNRQMKEQVARALRRRK